MAGARMLVSTIGVQPKVVGRGNEVIIRRSTTGPEIFRAVAEGAPAMDGAADRQAPTLAMISKLCAVSEVEHLGS